MVNSATFWKAFSSISFLTFLGSTKETTLTRSFSALPYSLEHLCKSDGQSICAACEYHTLNKMCECWLKQLSICFQKLQLDYTFCLVSSFMKSIEETIWSHWASQLQAEQDQKNTRKIRDHEQNVLPISKQPGQTTWWIPVHTGITEDDWLIFRPYFLCRIILWRILKGLVGVQCVWWTLWGSCRKEFWPLLCARQRHHNCVIPLVWRSHPALLL